MEDPGQEDIWRVRSEERVGVTTLEYDAHSGQTIRVSRGDHAGREEGAGGGEPGRAVSVLS